MLKRAGRLSLRSWLPHVRYRPAAPGLPRRVEATPRHITALADCDFYHDMDLPGLGRQAGAWDLRGREAEYLGNVPFHGKRVLELGTANGALGFWIERQGANVVCYDLSPDHDWDIVPYARVADEIGATVQDRKRHIQRLNNAWWLAHRLLNSRARLVHGDVYHIPEAIGAVDIVTFGAILLHLRDPFQALANGLRLARETAVVVDLLIPGTDPDAPVLRFVPDAATTQPRESWWLLTPALVTRMLAVHGFADARVTFHKQKHHGNDMEMFTVVAHRTSGPLPRG